MDLAGKRVSVEFDSLVRFVDMQVGSGSFRYSTIRDRCVRGLSQDDSRITVGQK